MKDWYIGQDVVCISGKAELFNSACVGFGHWPLKDKIYKIDGFVTKGGHVFLVLAGADCKCKMCGELSGWHDKDFRPVEKKLPKLLTDLLEPIPTKKAKELEKV